MADESPLGFFRRQGPSLGAGERCWFCPFQQQNSCLLACVIGYRLRQSVNACVPMTRHWHNTMQAPLANTKFSSFLVLLLYSGQNIMRVTLHPYLDCHEVSCAMGLLHILLRGGGGEQDLIPALPSWYWTLLPLVQTSPPLPPSSGHMLSFPYLRSSDIGQVC